MNATDPDGDILDYSWTVSAGVLSSTTDSSVTYTSSDSIGSVEVKVTVSDGQGYSVTDTLTLTIVVTNEAVTGFLATNKPNGVSLVWTNPTSDNFASVMVRRSTDSFPSLTTQGDLVYEGTNEFVLDSGLTPDTTYYYSVWAKNN